MGLRALVDRYFIDEALRHAIRGLVHERIGQGEA